MRKRPHIDNPFYEDHMRQIEITELREQRHALAQQIMVWRREISELNRADQQDGVRLGYGNRPSIEQLKRQVEHRDRVQRLTVDATDAEEKLATIDGKLRIVEADSAEKAVREAVAALQKAETPADWVKLRDALYCLRHHGRIGQSSEMVRQKIERLSQPGTRRPVRVRDRLEDFLHWLPKTKAVAA